MINDSRLSNGLFFGNVISDGDTKMKVGDFNRAAGIIGSETMKIIPQNGVTFRKILFGKI
jgi:hypothetical protein